MKIGIAFALGFLLVGCSAQIANGDKNEIIKLIEKKDKKIEELNSKIADLEAKKLKYKEELEMYNNNPVLNELDELLKTQETNQTEQE